MNTLISLIIAYLLGSISFAILVSKILKTPDPRTQGSKNAGATNVLRTMGTKAAVCVLIGDALKGLIAVIIGRLLDVEGFLLALVLLAAVVGHVFPVYFKFQGGKGVATLLAALLGLSFWVGFFAILTWIVVVFISRYVSVGSLVAVVAAVVYILIAQRFDYFVPVLLAAALVVWKHWPNIERLRNKTEAKLILPHWLKPKG